MSKSIRRIASVAAPIALNYVAPGIGTAIGTALGAGAAAAPIVGSAVLGGATGALTGNGIKGIGAGAITGGLAGGGGTAIAQGLGATGSVASGLGSALTGGAAAGLSGGNIGDILTGAAIGGGLGYVNSGGAVPGLGSVSGSTLDQVTGIEGLQGPTQGSGVLGNFAPLTGGEPMRIGSLLSAAGDIGGYALGSRDIDEINKMLAARSAQAQAQFSPFAQAGERALANLEAPSMEALMADPGYQFQLQEGQRALERSLAAQGLGQSGAALRAAQEYGQGLANRTYNDYFNRQALLANQGLAASSGLGSLYTNLGNTQAAAEIERMNQRNNMLSGLGRLFA